LITEYQFPDSLVQR